MGLKRVVITGLGSLTPLGRNVPELWEALINGVSGATRITRFNPEKFKCQIACELKEYNALDYFDKKESRRLDLFSQYGIVAGEEAIKDSGIDDDTINKERIGVVWGSGIGGVNTFQEECMSYQSSGFVPRFSPFFAPKMISDICAGHLSINHGFRGPNFASVAACASSAAAISDAYNLIRLNKADIIVTGGSEAAITECCIGAFASMMALSVRNDSPETASRPFDKDRDGFVLAEGAASMVLEEYEHAKARGAHIYAELTGCGLTADAYHITAPHPEGTGAYNAMRLAIEESEMKTDDVDYINTHGTSTPLGDKAEVQAISNLFGEHAPKISLDSTKSMTGHLLGAAGCVEAIATVLAIKDGIIPPTINHFTDDTDIVPLDFTFGKAVKRDVNFALSNAFGFGGHNVCLAFRKI